MSGVQAMGAANTLNAARLIGQTGLAGSRLAAAAPLTAATTVADAIRTPFDLATGRDSLQNMQMRDLQRIHNPEYGTGAIGKVMGYADAVSANTARPVASAAALVDSGLDTSLRVPSNLVREWQLDRDRTQQVARHQAETQQAMQAGTALGAHLDYEALSPPPETAGIQPES